MRLIDADRLLCVIGDGDGCAYDGLEYQAYMSCLRRVLEDIEEAPTIDPETLRPTARWIRKKVSCIAEAAFCSNCGRGTGNAYKYCPNCGAKMIES